MRSVQSNLHEFSLHGFLILLQPFYWLWVVRLRGAHINRRCCEENVQFYISALSEIIIFRSFMPSKKGPYYPVHKLL